jgi:hypothetical protein
MLLKKGCEVVLCTSNLHIHLPFQKYDYTDFKQAEDGLFYMDLMPLDLEDEPAEQANSNVVLDEDDSSSGDGNGNMDHRKNDNENADDGNDNDNIDEEDDHGDSKRQSWNQSISIAHMSSAIIRERQSFNTLIVAGFGLPGEVQILPNVIGIMCSTFCLFEEEWPARVLARYRIYSIINAIIQ